MGALPETVHPLTLDLLAWVARSSRTYGETMEAWSSHCPRHLVWEDAVVAGLLRVDRGKVHLTPPGRALLDSR